MPDPAEGKEPRRIFLDRVMWNGMLSEKEERSVWWWIHPVP